MDTNMSQALKLAGGLLIAIVLISALVYFFRALVPTQIALDDIKQFEQTIDFNKEFEVYNKDIMYGLDVISVINKAASYNKTYIDAYGYTDELKDNYLVDIELTLNTDVEEKIQVYYTNSTVGERKELEYLTSEFDDPNAPFNRFQPPDDGRNINFNNIFDELGIESTEVVRRNTLLSRDPYTILDSGEYTLIRNSEVTKYCNPDLYSVIIEDSVKPQKVIKNNQNNFLVGEWTKVVYTTGVYNFKSKRFRCVGVEYSDITQRITKLRFEEI